MILHKLTYPWVHLHLGLQDVRVKKARIRYCLHPPVVGAVPAVVRAVVAVVESAAVAEPEGPVFENWWPALGRVLSSCCRVE